MSDYTPSTQELWARLRFSIVGRLLSGPPSEGELEGALRELAASQWNHPTQPGKTKSFSFSTLEKWYYRARASRNPIDALRGLVRKMPVPRKPCVESTKRSTSAASCR